MIVDFLRRFLPGDPVRVTAAVEHQNMVSDILNTIEGLGCRIEKTPEGKGWMVIVDGGSDIERPSGFPSVIRPDLFRIAATDSSASDKAISDVVCDGTADDAEINAALDTVACGGTVYLMPGNYSLANGLSARRPVNLMSKTRNGRVTVKADAAFTADYLVYIGDDITVGSPSYPFSNPAYVSVYGITLDGNSRAKHGLYISQTLGSMHVAACTAQNCTEAGFAQDRDSGAAVWFRNCVATANKLGFAIGYGAMTSANGRATWMHTCQATSNTSHGVHANSACLQLENCTASNNAGSGILCSNPSKGARLVDCTASGNGGYGITGAGHAIECAADNNASVGYYAVRIVVASTGTGNGTYDAQYVDYLCGCTLTSKANVTDDADAPAYSGTFAVVTAVDFVNQTVTTKSITVAADGRVTNVV